MTRQDRQEREHPRFAHEAAITLHAPGVTTSGRTENLSRGGLCATLTEPVVVGGDLEIDIQLVFDDEHQSEALRLPARIVWCTPVDDGYQVGVRFLPLSLQQAEDLTMFLRYLDDSEGSSGRTKPSRRATTVDDRFG